VVKNPNWKDADQLAIYRRDRGVELGTNDNNISWWSERGLNPHTLDFKFGALDIRPRCLLLKEIEDV